MATSQIPDTGALVGWTLERVGDRCTLRLQVVDKPPPHGKDDVHSFYLMLDGNQAAQLGNNLFEVMDRQKPPPRPPGRIARFFKG